MNTKRNNKRNNVRSKLLREFFKIDQDFEAEYNWAVDQIKTARKFTELVKTISDFKTVLKFDTRTPIVNVFKSRDIRAFFYHHLRKTKRHFKRSEQKVISRLLSCSWSEIREESIDFILVIYEEAIDKNKSFE